MTIFDKVLEIYQKYYICLNCLGRMFSLLGTNTTNLERGKSLLLSVTMENHRKYLSGRNNNEYEALQNLKILAENANFSPAKKVLKNEGRKYSVKDSTQTCYLCNNIFNHIQKYVDNAIELSKDYEFNNILVGTSPDSRIINQEDNFKAEFKLLEAESFKSHFNRVVGKELSINLNKPSEFENPDLVFIYSIGFELFKIDLNIKSLFVSGRYNKLIRGIPQTHWVCKRCMGKGCELCNFSGKKYNTSVEELISPEFVKEAQATDSKFHGAGREDIDVRMLGTGRPFILELRNLKIRTLDLDKISERVNQLHKEKIKITNLRYSNKKEVINIKDEAKNVKKVYKAIVKAEKTIDKQEFKEKVSELKFKFENQNIRQRTPLRVSHRRADKIREKKIYKIDGAYIEPKLYEFTIETQGGTYIKELINGDEDRTTPSFAEIFGYPLVCKELDVIDIEY